ncbi:MAG: hypothetical protein KAX05_10550 [Bacteroidales bacterium]|nr:hypothetical protein [Bacteroidales bacterium]
MEKTKNEGFRFDSIDLILYVYRKKIPLIVISLFAFLVSLIASLTIPPKFKSTVIMFPTSSTSVSKTLLTDNPSQKGILTLGEEEEAEQMLQILNSGQIRDRIIMKYDLMDHYEVDPDSKFPLTRLRNKYKKNISFKKTKFMSVEISVLDTDPQMAANIADNIASLVDSTMNLMQQDRAFLALKVVEDEYFSLRDQIRVLEDSLNVLRGFGVYEYESQAEVFSDAYAIAIAAGNVNGAREIEKKLKVLEKYGGAYVSIRDFLEFEKKHLSELKAKYAEAQVEANQNLPHKFIVDQAYIAEKKSYPKKSLIVFVSTVSAFFLALILMFVFESVRKRVNS